MGSRSSSNNTRSLIKALFGSFSLIFWFFSVGIVSHGGLVGAKTTVAAAAAPTGHQSSRYNFKHMKEKEEEEENVMGKENLVAHQRGLEINYMSKRRVPNGPDPIHNRRAGNSRRPPGQA